MEIKDVVFIAALAALQYTFIASLLSLGAWVLDRTLGPVETGE
jgi:hypothetical protein